ncbi:hypothetical protein M758_4G214600 [Ceratodon purpureus]|nr:hypothetical protein M758_4G214600 [Ceratodon purpureus]
MVLDPPLCPPFTYLMPKAIKLNYSLTRSGRGRAKIHHWGWSLLVVYSHWFFSDKQTLFKWCCKLDLLLSQAYLQFRIQRCFFYRFSDQILGPT